MAKKQAAILSAMVLTLPCTSWAITYTSIANGNWTAATTWSGGVVPGSTINAADRVNIHHLVNYDNGGDLDNSGFFSIRTLAAAPAAAATLYVPSGRTLFNRAGATWEVYYGNLQQCRFVPSPLNPPTTCQDTGVPQSGKIDNEGGTMNVTSSFIEIAQDWTNLDGGVRTITDSCVKTGQNFSQVGAASRDNITNTSVSVGWQGSGNISYEGALTTNRVRYQTAGASGGFEINSGSVSGDIDYIYLKNHVNGVAGSGGISVSSSVVGTMNLDAYFAPISNYVPNGKFTGTQTLTDQPVGGVTYFPDATCNTANKLPPLNSNMQAALGTTTPTIVSPGQVLTGLTAVCTNLGPGAAAAATCVPSVSVGTISALICLPPSPQAILAVSAAISCTYTYTAPGASGGANEPTTGVTFTATTSATNDVTPANNVATLVAGVIDAVNDTDTKPAAAAVMSNLALNDQFPADSLFNVQPGGTCGAPIAVSPAGVASYTSPATVGATCTVNYQVCAPAPNAAVCDTATLLVTASAPQAALVIAKTDSQTTTASGSTNIYIVTLTNQGPSPANGVVLTDTPNAGLTCPPASLVVCSVITGPILAVCPTGTLTLGNLISPGYTIVTFPANSGLQFTYTCNVN